MFMPSFTLWTLDGPPEETSDAEMPPIPPKPSTEEVARQASISSGVVPQQKTDSGADADSDQDEFHDTKMTPPDELWDWNHAPYNSLSKFAPPITPPQSGTIAQRILAGEHHTATFDGTSQYARGGSSACGLASMNAVRLAFDLCSNTSDGEALISALVSEEYVKDSMAIAASWSDQMHLEVEPILELPIFARSLQVIDVQYREARFRAFSDALIALQSDEGKPGPRAVFLTRPPEMIAVMHIPIVLPSANPHQHPNQSIYLIFDSHPRPSHPNGAAVQLFPSSPTDNVADYLADLFQIDSALINDPTLEWHVQLLGQVSCHFLAPVEVREVQTEYSINMAFLALKQQLAEAKQKLDSNENEKRQMRSRVFDLQQEVALLNNTERKKEGEIRQLKARLNEAPKQPQTGHSDWSWGRSSGKSSGKGKAKENSHTRSVSKTSGAGNPYDNEWPKPQPNGSSHTFPPPRSTLPAPSRANTGPSSSHRAATNGDDEGLMRSLEVAMAMQQAFDEEQTALMRDQSLARAVERPKFDCGICMDSFTDEAVAFVDGCDHSCCRECMRGHVESKINERRYPIPCPFCVAGSEDDSRPKAGAGLISSSLVETIGVTAESFNIFTELQMAEYSIMIDCRRCSQSAFVDRKDYDLVEIIACPLPRCNYSWCKQCNQSIEGGAKHSCDGSAELETLMNQRGWKHCPGCRTPIERSAGCNHMTCSTPGCNMHFCYICGAIVIRGGTRQEIQTAVSSHYRSCALFDVPRER